MAKRYTGQYSVLNQFTPLTEKYGAEYGVDPTVIDALIWRESRGNPNATNKTAKGLTQFTPIAMREFGVTDPFDPAQAIEGTAKFLARYWHAGAAGALQAYNAGAPGHKTERIGGVPYEDAVLATARELAAQKGSSTASIAPPPRAPTPAPAPPRVAAGNAVASAKPKPKPKAVNIFVRAWGRLRRWLRGAKSDSGNDLMS